MYVFKLDFESTVQKCFHLSFNVRSNIRIQGNYKCV